MVAKDTWLALSDINPAPELPWLSERGKLTDQLRHSTQCTAELTVLSEKFIAETWVRNITIRYGKELQEWARVTIAKRDLTGEAAKLQHIGKQVLGDILFQDPNLERSPIEVAQLTTKQALYQAASCALQKTPPFFWARRSTFTYFSASVHVCEIVCES